MQVTDQWSILESFSNQNVHFLYKYRHTARSGLIKNPIIFLNHNFLEILSSRM